MVCTARILNFIAWWIDIEPPKKEWMIFVTALVATKSKLLIGYLQIAQMVELGLQVKLSANKLEPTEAQRLCKNVLVSFYCAVGICTLIAVFMTINHSINYDEYQPWQHFIEFGLFPIECLIVAIGLAVAYIFMAYNLHKYFS